MVAQTDRRVLWHPRHEHKFAVGGGANITLYEWAPDSPIIRHVSSQDDLQHMKCFAWSPDPGFDDLIAVGLSNGKVDLMRLEANRFARDNGVLSRGPVVTLPVRSSRACNAVAFCQANPNYLACGLDKVRGDNSLVIWDLETTLPKLAISLPAPTPGLDYFPSSPPLHSPSTSFTGAESRTTPRILHQTAPAEIVSAVAFMPHSTHVLLAGISGRFIRLHDLRAPTAPPTTLPCKVQTLATDPFDAHRFACAGDSGTVAVWDMRALAGPLLTFSHADSAGDGARTRGAVGAPAIEFSRTRRGVLATMEKDATQVRLWSLQDAPVDGPRRVEAPKAISRESSQNRTPRLSWTNPSSLMSSWTGGSPSAGVAAPTPGVDTAPYHLVLANTWKSKTFSRPLTSFALVPTSSSNALTTNVMLVNKEGDLELYALHDTPTHVGWSSRGDLSISAGVNYRLLHGHQEDRALHASLSRAEPSGLLSQVMHAPPASHLHSGGDTRRPSATHPSRQHQATAPRPSASTTGRRVPSGGHADAVHAELPGSMDEVTLDGRARARPSRMESRRPHGHPEVSRRMIQHAVEDDISMVMRRRALLGYGLVDPLRNSSITDGEPGDDDALSELWKWLDQSKQLLSSPTSKVQGFDFAYQGVLGVWEGLVPLPRPTPDLPPAPTPSAMQSATASPVSSYRNLRDVPNSSLHTSSSTLTLPGLSPEAVTMGRRRSKASSRRSYSPADSLYGDFSDAALTILSRKGIAIHRDRDKTGTPWRRLVSNTKHPQRRLALELCGWDFGDVGLSETITIWEQQGQTARAACWFVFNDQHGKAVELLMRSEDEAHFMLSVTLAGLTSLAGDASKRAELHAQCQRLVVRLQDPYLRAMVTRLTTEDWADVLDEIAIPLRERLAIALQFLDDSELTSYLRRVAEECRMTGDIAGLAVTGLTPSGLEILRAWLDRTGDVQSAAMLASYVSPARVPNRAVDRWVDAYRDLLDGWRLFHQRCQFDIDRGEILQRAIREGDVEPFEWAPKQIMLRCNYCNKALGAHDSTGAYNGRPTVCSSCERPLPRCSVCLLTLSVVPDNVRDGDLASKATFHDTFDDALVICQTCRHGGHASHIIEWFFDDNGTRVHAACPVADCECTCADDM